MATKTGNPGVSNKSQAEAAADVEKALGGTGAVDGVSVADLDELKARVIAEGLEIEQVVQLKPGQQLDGLWRGIFLAAPSVNEKGEVKQLPFAHIEVTKGLVAKIVASYQILTDLREYPAGQPVCIIMGNKVDMPGKGGKSVNRYLIAKKPVIRAALGAAPIAAQLPPKS